jgi:predicted dehydrogenase
MPGNVNFGLIGCGLMGRLFADAVRRWDMLQDGIARPVIRGICSPRESSREWFSSFEPKYSTADYRELLDKPDIEAIYCAVPHHLHEELYTAVIRAGKHLMGEKPFGIDRAANAEILEVLAVHPGVFARCAGEFPFYPGCMHLIDWLREERFGRIIEVRAGFCHSSDMDGEKPINWKRIRRYNGEYGCMGDLGMHTQHIPFRMGLIPKTVSACLSKFITRRPDGKGGMADCDTWDNAILTCEGRGKDGEEFPMVFETKRMSPGSTNRWYLEIYGMEASAKFTTEDPGAFFYTQSWGKEQAWCRINLGYKPQFKTAVGPIFEFGFADSILQMWAAFMAELEGKTVSFGCVRPEETRISHALCSAALDSYREKRVMPVEW